MNWPIMPVWYREIIAGVSVYIYLKVGKNLTIARVNVYVYLKLILQN